MMWRRIALPAALALAAAGCGGIPRGSTQACGGCSFVFATSVSGDILTGSLTGGGNGFPASQTPGPAHSLGIAVWRTEAGAVLVYASDPGAAAIRAYRLNLTNGTMSPASPAAYALGGAVGEPMQILAANQVLYVAESGGFVGSYAIQADGTLQAVAGSPFAAGPGTSHLCAEGSTTAGSVRLYAANSGDAGGSISAFAANSSGQLTPVAGTPFASGGEPEGLLCAGTTLYAALPGRGAVAGFAVAASGGLAPLAGSPYAAGAGATSLEQVGQLLCVENAQSISALSINSQTGALAATAAPPFTVPGAEGELPLDADGVLVPSAGEGLLPLSLDVTSGAFSQRPGSALFPGTSPLVSAFLFIPVLDPT